MFHHVYLVPGFVGFANLGELMYFAHVRGQLEAAFARRGARARVHDVPTLPTASLRRRAARLLEVIDETRGDDGPIYLVGHSTGGLDARLLVTPNASLPVAVAREPVAARVRAVVTIASPHHGTPLAALFTSVLGQKLLKLLSIMTMHGIRLGTIPLPAVMALAGALTGALPGTGMARRALGRFNGGILDQVYRQVLTDFSAERRDLIAAFLGEVGAEQALLPQLSPEGMDVFDATVSDRPGVRYGCVVTRAPLPTLSGAVGVGVSPGGQAMYALYRALHRMTALPPGLTPAVSVAHRKALQAAYGDVPGSVDNDAIVPTLSQLWGEVVHICRADHLDVIGHFADPLHDPPHVDWISTRSAFRRRDFEALWASVADFLLASA